ncbi:YopX-like protein [Shewanella sp. phage 1/40]|uniref:YopX-like protein n=1 Tax=Shewanella sp. phage 1/40 TaxID=1458860 RepID=UPI0004F60802|nr:YopX-like protein [Shewanella sp. phage 1/40]AHK11484.1 YopX-like protein [Shewanella sp. phage 1/40]
MRQTEFRGWCDRDDEWRYGYYVTDGKVHEIMTHIEDCGMYASQVDIESIGQFTAVLDKDGTKIFEGDKVESYHFTDTKGKHHFINHIVTWSDKFNGWFMQGEYDTTGEEGSIQLWVYMRTNKHSAKVVGNIHQ